jgi:dolichol-phosphate mannosyltransferase
VAKTIEQWEIELLIVDSSSPDGTAQTVRELQKTYDDLHIIETPKEGLGRAYVNGFSYALEHLRPFVIFEMDADLSHNPNYIPHFLKKIEQGADFVIGSRYIKGGSIPANWGLHRKIFSVCANLFVRLGFMKLSTTDWTGGYRAIKSWVVKSAMNHISHYTGYVFQVALLDYAQLQGSRLAEVPIAFVDRTEGESKINSFQYIMQTFLYVLTHSSFIKYVITGFMGFGVDFGISYALIASHMAKGTATIISAEFAIVANFLMNNFWSFKDKKITGGVIGYATKFLFFNLVSSGSIVIQYFGIVWLLRLFGDRAIHISLIAVPSWIIYKILIIGCVIIPYSYILYNKLIWKKKE